MLSYSPTTEYKYHHCDGGLCTALASAPNHNKSTFKYAGSKMTTRVQLGKVVTVQEISHVTR